MTVWDSIRSDVSALVKEKGCGPILIRLSWHDAGTYSAKSKTGGPHACMRFKGAGESSYGCNAGLDIAIKLIMDIKNKYPDVSSADFWAISANAAIEAMGGPKIPFRPGRKDAKDVSESVEDGRLPDASLGAEHIRDIFYRMGFDDQAIVALSGAHAVGRCHKDRSGFEGPWTTNPLKFDNSYFKVLLEEEWEKKTLDNGHQQWTDKSGKGLMMLNTDIALIDDAAFKPFVELYARDGNKFNSDFAVYFEKLQELGVESLGDVV